MQKLISFLIYKSGVIYALQSTVRTAVLAFDDGISWLSKCITFINHIQVPFSAIFQSCQ